MSSTNKQKKNRIIITVLGPDKVGLISGVAKILSKNNINILDISQSILQEFLAMILVADMERSYIDVSSLKKELEVKGEELGVRIDTQHEDVFNYMHRI
ncbi:MAG: ACT domain-containing protein [Clostridiales bacterium]|nr:ACT domain-containing protein [Clostridiales bacterium]MCF8021480.1 ACT domain-containing protein [Clostridiales bacterium]